jgi:hypothetical protein
MNRIIYFFLAILLSLTSLAQEQENISAISMSVVLPVNIEGLSESQLSRLESKIVEALTDNGLAAEGYSKNFIIYPKFEINSETETKGGMKKLITIDASLSLFIKQPAKDLIFSSVSIGLQGTGFDRNEAINEAISTFSPSSPKISEFITKGREKIIKHYETNCPVIIRSALSDKNLKKYESSLSTLLTVPEEVPECFERAQAEALIVFKELQKQQCEQFIQQAKAHSASQNYDAALLYLGYIDPSGPCASQSQQLLSQISPLVEDSKRKAWDFLTQAYTDKTNLKKMQLRAMHSLALSWLESQKNSPNQTIIIR